MNNIHGDREVDFFFWFTRPKCFRFLICHDMVRSRALFFLVSFITVIFCLHACMPQSRPPPPPQACSGRVGPHFGPVLFSLSIIVGLCFLVLMSNHFFSSLSFFSPISLSAFSEPFFHSFTHPPQFLRNHISAGEPKTSNIHTVTFFLSFYFRLSIPHLQSRAASFLPLHTTLLAFLKSGPTDVPASLVQPYTSLTPLFLSIFFFIIIFFEPRFFRSFLYSSLLLEQPLLGFLFARLISAVARFYIFSFYFINIFHFFFTLSFRLIFSSCTRIRFLPTRLLSLQLYNFTLTLSLPTLPFLSFLPTPSFPLLTCPFPLSIPQFPLFAFFPLF